ncbi:hypothetical protein [Mixta theicola]|nr:hypothetical protein [Mixta theicola]GLR07689.1 hypothetical protein GCM10007905_04080 [Mixta theicola]
MKNKFKFLAAGLTIIGAAAFYFNFSTDNRHFSCLAQYHVQNNGLRANMLMRFFFDGPSGFVTMNGEFINASGIHKVISRKVLFDFTTTKSNYLLTSKAIIPAAFDETDNHSLAYLLEGFYTNINQLAQYNIHYDGNGGYIFMNGNVPVLLCAGS